MGSESIGFAVQTTVVGMLIVFGFLSFLAVTMVVLSRLFKDSESNSGESAAAGVAVSTATIDSVDTTHGRTDNSEMAGVVVAAAAAYIEHEQRSSEASATQWSGIASHASRN